MSCYRNFIEDFPSRCQDVLNMAVRQARFEGRDVTLLLMVASAALVLPYERLRLGSKDSHPSGDVQKYSEAAEQLNTLLNSNFLGSSLWGKDSASWKYYNKLQSVKCESDIIKQLQLTRSLTKDKQVRSIFKTLRNALAHGNIFTLDDPIENIVFISSNFQKKRKGVCPLDNNDCFDSRGDDSGEQREYSIISVSPDDFHDLLENWFAFVRKFNLNQNDLLEGFKDVA